MQFNNINPSQDNLILWNTKINDEIPQILIERPWLSDPDFQMSFAKEQLSKLLSEYVKRVTISLAELLSVFSH